MRLSIVLILCFWSAVSDMIELLENLIVHPEMLVDAVASTDLLSHVLAQIHLMGGRLYSGNVM